MKTQKTPIGAVCVSISS